MKAFALLIALAILTASAILLSSCNAKDPNAHYVCFGGLKVKSLEECDFSKMNISLEKCKTQIVYESGSSVSTANEVVVVFREFKKTLNKNITFVSASYYGMRKGVDYYRMNFYDYSQHAKKQYFVDSYGRVYKPSSCKEG